MHSEKEIPSIAARIKYFRKLKGITQDELAKACDIDPTIIRKYETSARIPKIEQVQTIASALDVSPLVFYENDINTVGEAMTLIMQLHKQTKLKITGEKDEEGNYIASSMTLNFDDKKLNEALAQYITYEEVLRKRTDEKEYTLGSPDEELLLQMDQTKLKKSRKTN